jgi:hypothetical protein
MRTFIHAYAPSARYFCTWMPLRLTPVPAFVAWRNGLN